jgi:hypothetical protein
MTNRGAAECGEARQVGVRAGKLAGRRAEKPCETADFFVRCRTTAAVHIFSFREKRRFMHMLRMKIYATALAVSAVTMAAVGSGRQETPPAVRSIKSDDFAGMRPDGSGKRRTRSDYAPAGREARVRRGKAAAARPEPTSPARAEELVGVTLWRLRPAQAGDDPKQGILVQAEARGSRTELRTPVRASLAQALAVNDLVRVTVEAQREGHLYVINSELRSDGSAGTPYLIFPETERTDTRIAPGMVVDVPDRSERWPYFRLANDRADYVGELLTVIVSPTPLDWRTKAEGEVGDVGLLLRLEAAAGETARFERREGTGEAETAEEREATAGSKTRAEKSGSAILQRRLKRDQPLPQTVYAARPDAQGVTVAPIRLRVKK